jgi:rhodanese-related sulfurtransferase
MDPGGALPTLGVVHVDAARTAPDGAHPRTATPILLDVRERHEFAAVRVPGALLYPTSSFLLRFSELPRDRPIHVICHTGSRSAAVTSFLLRNGWTQVYNVAGGMDAWERAGLEVRRGPLAPGEGDPPD